MGEAIGGILALAVAVAISPLPIIGVVLLLTTPRARVNGLAFVAGCLLGLAVVGAVVLLAAPDPEADGGPATWVSTLKLVLGCLLVLLAIKQWRSRPREGQETTLPKWMDAVGGFSGPKSFGAGVVLSGANPKNLLLAIAAAASIAQTGIPAGEQAIAYAVFMLIGIVGVSVPVVIYLALGDRAGPMLAGLKGWMARNNAVIMAVLLLVIGAKLVGDAISGFAG